MLSIEDLAYSVGGRRVIDGLELRLSAGESAVVHGRSGSGKSTLLMCVLGMLRPDRGRIMLDDAEVTGLGRSALARLRRERLGVVFQDGELLPELTPVENVALPALLDRATSSDGYDRAEKLLASVGVPSDTPTGFLSGGERQRTAVARALINQPDLILADEPTGALDEQTRDAVAEVLFELPRSHGCALLVVTHDPAVAECADSRYALVSGVLEEADG